MPRRWLSARTRKEDQETSQEIREAPLQTGFDFALTAEKHVQPGRCQLYPPEGPRPTTSDGTRYKARRKPDLTLLIERPKSSDSIAQNKPLSTALFDDSQIGVAFGSPRHPPKVIESIASTMSPDRQRHAFFLQEALPTHSAKEKKWKIGDLFRPRASSNREPNFYRVQRIEVAETKKLGLPIVRTPWRNPKSPAAEQNHFGEHTPSFIEREASQVVPSSLSAVDERLQYKDSHPRQIAVSGTLPERCGVTSNRVNGVTQSGLLTRRSREVNQLLIATDFIPESTELVVPKLVRRVTSPTTSKNQDRSRIYNNEHASSKYSLFPRTPTSSNCLCETDSPASARTRSVTAPPQLSLAQAIPLDGSEGRRTDSEQRLALFPLRCESLIDSGTSNSAMADSARVSSQNEIFFDIQSFRDSKGQVGQHFEMTRPPSAAVQLARSKSNARRLLQEKLDTKARIQQQIADEDRAEKTTSAEIDETIAMVESLMSPSKTDPALQRLPQSTYNPDLKRSSKQNEEEQRVYAVDVESTNKESGGRRTESKTRLDILNIDVPSPVLEQGEETTPKRLCSTTPPHLVHQQQPEQTMPTVAGLTGKPTSLSPRPVRNTPSPRPGLPIKDSKYIPLSKYAPRRTTEDLVRQTGLRPVRATRSNTGDTTTWNARTSSLPRPCLERSSTMPPLHHAKTPLSNRTNLPPPVLAGPGTKDSPSMVAYVKPAAEVSIARTVSLSRKPSVARVIGSKVSTRAASRKEQVQEEVKEREVVLCVPVVQEVHKGHKPGLSQEVVLDTATIAPSSPPPPLPSPSLFVKAAGEDPPLLSRVHAT